MRRPLYSIFLFAVALTLGACRSTYHQTAMGGVEAPSARLDPTISVLVSIPEDGGYGNKPSIGTGKMVAQQTAAAFSHYARRVQIAEAGLSQRAELIDAARKADAGYLVIPTITHWERRATEWSGIPSRSSISITVVDARSDQELRSTLLESRSRIVSFTRTSPEALLPHLLKEHVTEIYEGSVRQRKP